MLHKNVPFFTFFILIFRHLVTRIIWRQPRDVLKWCGHGDYCGSGTGSATESRETRTHSSLSTDLLARRNICTEHARLVWLASERSKSVINELF